MGGSRRPLALRLRWDGWVHLEELLHPCGWYPGVRHKFNQGQLVEAGEVSANWASTVDAVVSLHVNQRVLVETAVASKEKRLFVLEWLATDLKMLNFDLVYPLVGDFQGL